MNTELALVLLKFAGTMLLIMGLVMLMAILTPVIAKKIDKNKDEPIPERVDDSEYTVKGPYDKQSDGDFDPNYKIYNTDIYGMDSLKNKKNDRKDEKNGKK